MAAAKKSSNNLPKIVIIVVILLLLGVGAYFVLGNGKNSMMGSAVNKITSAKDMLTASVSMHCEYDENNIHSKVEIKNGAVRVDSTGQTEDENGSIILKGKKMYMWRDKEGYVYDIPDEVDENGKTIDSESTQKEDLMKSLEAYKDACKPAVVSDSIFNPPSDVTFTDMSSMMKNQGDMMKYQQQYAPQDGQYDSAPADSEY